MIDTAGYGRNAYDKKRIRGCRLRINIKEKNQYWNGEYRTPATNKTQ